MSEQDIILSKWLVGEVSDEEVRAVLGQEIDLVYLSELLNKQNNYQISGDNPMDHWKNIEPQLADSSSSLFAKSSAKITLVGVMLLIASMCLILWLNDHQETVHAKPKEFLFYAFEDGTEVKLFPDSEISYDKDRYMSERMVDLKGQAFFNVSKGETFKVKTTSGTVEVLGTSFDVWAADKGHLEVKCHTGKVKVSDLRANSSTLAMGERVRISQNQLGVKESFDPTQSVWKDNFKHYDEAIIAWVVDDLENLYDVDIVIDKQNMTERFSGVVSTNDENRAFLYLCETMGWSYEKSDKTIIITSGN